MVYVDHAPEHHGLEDWAMSHSRQLALGGCALFWAIVGLSLTAL